MKILIYILFILLTICPFYSNGGKKGGTIGGRGKTQTNIKPASNHGNAGINRGNIGGTGTNSLNSNKNYGTGGGGGSFNSGRTGYKSLSSNQKAGVAGALGVAAGAYIGYKIGSARSSFHYGGNQYWYGNRYYHPTSTSKRKCVFEVDETTPNWNVKDENNSIVREIVFECYTYETCCGMSCCRTPTHATYSKNHWAWWQTLLVILILGLLFAACAFFLIKQIKKRRQAQHVPSSINDDSQKPFVPTGYSDVNQTGYHPSQPHPNAGPPPYPGGYAAAPGYNYPPQPSQGYNYPPPQNAMYPPPTYQPVRTY